MRFVPQRSNYLLCLAYRLTTICSLIGLYVVDKLVDVGGAIDKTVVSMMCALFPSRFGPEPFAALLSELRHLKHSQLELIYLATCFSRSNDENHFSPFSKYNDQNAYAGRYPSHLTASSWIELLVASLPGTVLKSDYTFKVCY
jgi:hypothetical protein